MTESRKSEVDISPLKIKELPTELAEAYREKLHTALKANPGANYFKEILANGDTDAAREMIAYLMSMEENPWAQTEDDDQTQADIYSSSLRVLKLAKLVKQAKVKSDGKTPNDIEIGMMLAGISEPKEDLEALARLQDFFSKKNIVGSAGKILNTIKSALMGLPDPKQQEV